jgi:hypothetical protein
MTPDLIVYGGTPGGIARAVRVTRAVTGAAADATAETLSETRGEFLTQRFEACHD